MCNITKGMSLGTTPNQKPSQNPTASSLVASNQAPRCAYREGYHYPSACTTIKSVRDRHAFLLCIGRCFNCLKPQHCARNCKSSKKCRRCRKRHHQSICEGAKPSNSFLSLHLAKYGAEYSQIVDLVDQSLYVDDLVSGGANVHEAFEVGRNKTRNRTESIGACTTRDLLNRKQLGARATIYCMISIATQALNSFSVIVTQLTFL